MPYALGTAVFRESCHWGVDDCAVAGLTARVALYIRQVCSGNCLRRVGRLGPCFDLRTILGYRHSTTHLRPWLQRRLLVSEQAIASLDQRSLDCSWRKTPHYTNNAVISAKARGCQKVTGVSRRAGARRVVIKDKKFSHPLLHHHSRRLALKRRTPPPNGSGVHGHFCLSFSLGGCFLGGVFGLASGAGCGACL